MTKWEKIQHKIVSQEEASTIVNSWRDTDHEVVFTNGCFDILHRGHVTYLGKAATLGDFLVVGLNTDASVKRQGKGDDRPINNEESRALVLASLEFVDMIILFDNDTPEELISLLNPNILVKGADYDENEKDESSERYIIGSKQVLQNGGLVKTIELEEGYSTTNLIQKIKGS